MSDGLEQYYRQCCDNGAAIAPHLPRLRALASGCELAQEFGVKRGASTVALLLGAPRVLSYDLVATKQTRDLQALAGDRWTFRLQDSRQADVTPCDLLLVDSLHTYAQVHDELERHGESARRYLVFHDTLTFGSVGAAGESGQQQWTYVRGQSVPQEHLGIRPAIDQYMIRHPWWHIVASYTDGHGLLVLERAA